MNHIKLSILFLLVFSLYSCKEKTADTSSELSSVTEPQGTKFIVDTSNTNILWEGSKPGGKHAGIIKINRTVSDKYVYRDNRVAISTQ